MKARENQPADIMWRKAVGGGRQESERLTVEAYEHPLLADRARRNGRKRLCQLQTDELHGSDRCSPQMTASVSEAFGVLSKMTVP